MTKLAFAVIGLLWLSHCDEGAMPDAPRTATPDAAMNQLAEQQLRELPADKSYEGKTLEQWAVEYMRWSYSWTSETCTSAEGDTDGSQCGLYQPAESPVFFLASCNFAMKRGVIVDRTNCKVPAGKALLVPIASFSDDDAANSVSRAPEELEKTAAAVKASMRELSLVADQRSIHDLAAYSVGPAHFSFDIPASPNWHTCNGFVDVANKNVNPSYLVGYFVLIEPPTLGLHELEYTSIQTYYESDFYFHVRTRFVVE